jgi:hypothetical protein
MKNSQMEKFGSAKEYVTKKDQADPLKLEKIRQITLEKKGLTSLISQESTQPSKKKRFFFYFLTKSH